MSVALYIFGTTSYAQLAASYAQQMPAFTLCGYAVDRAHRDTEEIDGLPVVPFETLLDDKGRANAVFLAYGYRNMRTRQSLYERVAAQGFLMPNLIAPDAFVAPTVRLGQNNIVMPGAVIEHNVQLGDNNTIWSNVTLCHDSTFGAHNFFAANAVMGGHVQAGSRNFFGFSSTVEQYRRLGDENLLGTMSYLHEDALDHQRWLGVPARLAGSHEATGLRVENPR